MACRALHQPGKHLRLIMSDDKHERPTTPPSNSELKAAPVIPRLPPPSTELMKLAGYDENSFMHQAMLGVIDANSANNSRKESFDRFETNLDARFEKQTKAITTTNQANYDLIHQEVVSIGKQLDALGERVKTTEARLESGVERFERIETDQAKAFAELRAELKAMSQRVDQLERRALNEKEGPRAAEETEPAPPRESEPPASDR